MRAPAYHLSPCNTISLQNMALQKSKLGFVFIWCCRFGVVLQGEWEQSFISLQLFKSYILLKTCRRLEERKDNKKRHKNNKNNEKITGFHNSFSLISSFAPGYFPFLISLFFLVFTSEMHTTTSGLPHHKSLLLPAPQPSPKHELSQFSINSLFSPFPCLFQFSTLMGKKILLVFHFDFPCTF